MTQEYDEGPWVDVPEGALVEAQYGDGCSCRTDFARYRILTPKPRREFVVGKWYRTCGADWRRCIATEHGIGWLSYRGVAEEWSPHNIDWSVSPRDEAPE